MALAPIPWNPDRKTLREFSEAWMFVFGMIAAPLSYARGQLEWAAGLWLAAVLVRLVGLLGPSLLRPLFVGMLLAGWPVGWVVSNLILAIIYYVTLTPIAWLVRRRRVDPLHRTFEEQATTYWEPLPQSRPARDYLRQF